MPSTTDSTEMDSSKHIYATVREASLGPRADNHAPIESVSQIVANREAKQSANNHVSFALNRILTPEMTKRSVKQHKKWNRRLKIFFCCLGYKKNKDSIADVASIFAEYYTDLDVPSSDFAAGFVLLSKYQSAQREWIIKNQQLNSSSYNNRPAIEQFLSSMPITSGTKFLDMSQAKDSHLINELIYYMNYSLAIFGWPLQAFDDPCSLCCIWPYLKLSSCCRGSSRRRTSPAATTTTTTMTTKGSPDKQEVRAASRRKESVVGRLDEDNGFHLPTVLDDNCCGCNAASAESRLRTHNFEIIHISFKVNVSKVPFLVAADHSKQTIVVALRGSMSMSDMVTDMNGQTDKLPIENCPEDWLCHRGITRAADYVRQTLLQEHILDRAFQCRPDLGSQDYTLVLCGHSLGAGVAAILGILLRSRYPTLKSFLYSPPGGILSLPAVEYTKEFAVGTLLGNDVVPRLGIAQLERLRYHVLLASNSSNKSPGKILTRALCPSFCCGSNKVEYDPSQSLDLLHGNNGRPFDYNGSKVPFQVQPNLLYVPGRLIHVVKNYSFKPKARRLFKSPIYQAIWTENTDYDRIMIGEGMFYDHLPKNLMHSMKMLFSNTLPARKESTESASAARISPLPQQPLRPPGDDDPEVNHLAARLKENSISIEDSNNNSDDAIDQNSVAAGESGRIQKQQDSVGDTKAENKQLDQTIQSDANNKTPAVDRNGNDDSLVNLNNRK